MRTNRPVVYGRPAIRATLHQNLAANRAIFSPHRIRRHAIRSQVRPPIHFIGVIRRTLRVRTKSYARNGYLLLSPAFRHNLRQCPTGRHDLDIEELRQFSYDLVVELRHSAIFKHAQSRLLATDLLCNGNLAELRSPPGLLDLTAEFWTQIRHERILWTFTGLLTRGEI